MKNLEPSARAAQMEHMCVSYATFWWRWSCCLHFKSQVVPKKCWFKMSGLSGGYTLNQMALNQRLRTRPGSWHTDCLFLLDGPVQEELRGNWSDIMLLARGLEQLLRGEYCLIAEKRMDEAKGGGRMDWWRESGWFELRDLNSHRGWNPFPENGCPHGRGEHFSHAVRGSDRLCCFVETLII